MESGMGCRREWGPMKKQQLGIGRPDTPQPKADTFNKGKEPKDQLLDRFLKKREWGDLERLEMERLRRRGGERDNGDAT